jgi:hypothetical protein
MYHELRGGSKLAPEAQQQRNWIMSRPHEPLRNVNKRGQNGANRAGQQKENDR